MPVGLGLGFGLRSGQAMQRLKVRMYVAHTHNTHPGRGETDIHFNMYML